MKRPWRWFFLLVSFVAFGVTIHYWKLSRGTNMMQYVRWGHGINSYFQRRIFVVEHKSLTCCWGVSWDHGPSCKRGLTIRDQDFDDAKAGRLDMDDIFDDTPIPQFLNVSKRFAGFEFEKSALGEANRFIIKMPIWAISLLTLFYPFCLLLKWSRSLYRRYIGLCPHCSYNLTGNTSGVCPECGSKLSFALQESLQDRGSGK